jgi:opacity protein-like surface antigen
MRKIILSLAAAGAAVVAASPAAAQYYPQPQPAPYGYGNNGYGYNNGFQNNWGQVRALQARLFNVERQINRLDRNDRIRDRSADRLRDEANKIERRLRERARGGLDPREAGDLQFRIARLEQRVQQALANGYGRYGNGYSGYGFADRDRDGRDDRYEDDRGYQRDR